MLLGTLAASLLENMLAGKGVVTGGDGILEHVKKQIELFRIFNGASSFE